MGYAGSQFHRGPCWLQDPLAESAMSVEDLQRTRGGNAVFGEKSGAAYRVGTIADLRAVDLALISDGQVVGVLGYWTESDGAGGLFFYDSSSAAADNGGTVIAPDAGGGRWLRDVGGALNVKWFGAMGDNDTDDTDALTNAAAAASNMALEFPAGTYLTDLVPVTVQNVRFLALGPVGSTVIKQRTITNYRIFYVTANGVEFDGIVLDGGSSALSANPFGLIEFESCTGGWVGRCRFQNTGSDGITLNISGNTVCRNNTFTNVNRLITGNTQGVASVYGIQLLFNTGSAFPAGSTSACGFRLAASATFSNNYCRIIGNVIDSALTIGQACDLYRGNFDAVVSSNTFRGFDWGVSAGHCTRATFLGNTFKGNISYGLELAEGCLYCTVSGNSFDGKNAAGTAVMACAIAVFDGTSAGFTMATNNTVNGNTIRYGAATSKAIYVFGAIATNLSGNIVEGFQYGVQLQETTHTLFTGNELLTPLGGGTHMLVVDSAQDNNGLTIANNSFTGACLTALNVGASTFFVYDALIANNNTSGVVASSGFALTIGGNVRNLRVNGNHATSPDDPAASFNPEVQAIPSTGNYSVKDNDKTLLCADGADFSLILPLAQYCPGRIYFFKKNSGSTHTATVAGSSSQTIDGSVTYALLTAYKYLQIQSDGANWVILGKN